MLSFTRGLRRAIPLLRRMIELNSGSAQGRANLGYQVAISGDPELTLERARMILESEHSEGRRRPPDPLLNMLKTAGLESAPATRG